MTERDGHGWEHSDVMSHPWSPPSPDALSFIVVACNMICHWDCLFWHPSPGCGKLYLVKPKPSCCRAQDFGLASMCKFLQIIDLNDFRPNICFGCVEESYMDCGGYC